MLPIICIGTLSKNWQNFDGNFFMVQSDLVLHSGGSISILILGLDESLSTKSIDPTTDGHFQGLRNKTQTTTSAITTKRKTVNEENSSPIRYSELRTQVEFWEKFTFAPTGRGQERQRKQKKRPERRGKDRG